MADPRSRQHVAIVGAGMAGLSCADALVAQGLRVSLFDKGRGPGGRMSTRRIATKLGDAHFDHGAQYFTARDSDFMTVVASWAARDLAQPWPDACDDAWVGVPGMSALVRDMAGYHDVCFNRLVRGFRRVDGGWQLVGDDIDQEPFDAVFLAVPAEQAATLLAPISLAMAQEALLARSQPCWTGLFAFDAPLPTQAIIVRDQGLIAWAARNSAKPGRKGPEAWVVQAGGSWTNDHLNLPATEIQLLLRAALSKALAIDISAPIAETAHRWRYAMSAGSERGALWDATLAVGVCGDWLLGPRVECAWLSGRRLAQVFGAPSADDGDPGMYR